MQPELVVDCHCIIGEGPLWHPIDHHVYWVDIPKGHLYRYDPVGKTHTQLLEGPALGGFTIQADGSLVLFMDKGAIKIWRDGDLTTLYESLPGEETFRFNDVMADPAGRVFCGTMAMGSDPASNPGRLYRMDTDGSITQILDGIGISNGMGFTPDRKQMYYTDSQALKIYRFDYDETSGALSNQQVFAEVPDGEGLPDGMTVDAEGYVWSARWDGYGIVRYTPQGAVERRLSLPTKKVTSLTFGGADCTDMYITTAGGDDPDENSPLAGGLFHLNLGIRGLPEFPSRIKL
jgi:sugar lactone lactonase YvrE